MRIFILVMFIAIFSGCAMLQRAAPSQMDETGNAIPGTHQLTPLAQSTADAIPYGGVVASVFLLAMNFFEVAKSKKTKNGLMATIRAIEAASKDPDIKDAIAKLKLLLKESHQTANVQPLINELLAKVKYPS